MLEIVERVRTVMKKHRDGRKDIILTELTWPAAIGKVPRKRLLGLETTTAGQRKRTVRRIQAAGQGAPEDAHHPRLLVRVGHALRQQSQQSDVSYRFTGLNKVTDGGVFGRMPILSTYTSLAAKYEGCRKSSDARRCRG